MRTPRRTNDHLPVPALGQFVNLPGSRLLEGKSQHAQTSTTLGAAVYAVPLGRSRGGHIRRRMGGRAPMAAVPLPCQYGRKCITLLDGIVDIDHELWGRYGHIRRRMGGRAPMAAVPLPCQYGRKCITLLDGIVDIDHELWGR